MKGLTQSWLEHQCGMLDGISHAIVLMQDRENGSFTPAASWPGSAVTPTALLDVARDALRQQRELSRATGGKAGQAMVHACPVMLGKRMAGVVAVAARRCEETLRQLRGGCDWLSLLLHRESETGKHYLATMLEMAALFLEQQASVADEHTDHVVTRIIDTLNDHLGTDAGSLMQQLQRTVNEARSTDTPPADRQAGGDQSLARELATALETGGFVLLYQPKVELATGRIACMEALLRWDHPRRGRLTPERFLQTAGECGLMPAIDDWVLRSACRQLQAWHVAGHRTLSVAINLSTVGFMQPKLATRVQDVAGEHGIAPGRLEIEVTEGTVMENFDTATAMLRSLHEAGIRISVDDFGTGYSSLNYLQRFPISNVKIDRSFVSAITSDADIATIVRGIIAMAHASGLSVIAEGVETRAQLDFLRRLGCDQFQGYVFSRPLAVTEATQLLQAEAAGNPLAAAGQASSGSG